MTKEEYIQEQRKKVFQKIYNVNSSLQILEYNGTNKNITGYCERCGQEFTQHYTNLENNNFQCPKCRKIKTIQRKKPHITVRLFARGLDKEMGMSGTDAFASNWKVI